MYRLYFTETWSSNWEMGLYVAQWWSGKSAQAYGPS